MTKIVRSIDHYHDRADCHVVLLPINYRYGLIRDADRYRSIREIQYSRAPLHQLSYGALLERDPGPRGMEDKYLGRRRHAKRHQPVHPSPILRSTLHLLRM